MHEIKNRTYQIHEIFNFKPNNEFNYIKKIKIDNNDFPLIFERKY